MRFIGGKSLMLGQIEQVIQDNINEEITVIGDLFSGSGVVAQYFKKRGKKVICNDMMYMSYVLVRGMTELNSMPTFDSLGDLNVFEYLNSLTEPLNPTNAFISLNYAPNKNCDRMYFQPENAKKIDAIRQQIESWYTDAKLLESEYFYLLACLISAVPYVANIAGVYAAYLKHWDKRTYNKLNIVPLDVIHSEFNCESYNLDAKKLCELKSFDLAYIDTPYNQREYIPNYHILETIARYDAPDIKGVTGMRNYERSGFCSKATAKNAFMDLFSTLRAKYAVVSYSNEGLLSTEEMLSVFEQFGTVKIFEFPYRRYKSKLPRNEGGLKEQLYFIDFGA